MIKRKHSELTVACILLIVSSGCFVLHFIFFRYSFPPINSDEASFFSPSYNLALKGVLASEVHQSFLPGAARYTYWMPPLYMVFLGTVLKFFGATVFNAKLLSTMLTSCSAFLISFLSKDRFIKICAAALMLICPFILITSAFIRVEALAVLLIVASIVAVKHNAPSYLLGILAGLSVMTHPLLLACCAALGLTTIRRGIMPFIIFSLVALVVISPYIFYIFKDIEIFRLQMALQLSRKANARLSDLQPSYLLQSIPFAAIALFCLYKIKQLKELKLFLATGIILSLIVILRSNEFNYQVYLIPYFIASVVLVMDEKVGSVWYRYMLPLSVYGFFSLLIVFKFIKYNRLNDNSYRQMMSYLDANQNWKSKNIYLTGGTDLSNYFIVKNQHVERPIPIAITKQENWFSKYNYVLEVTYTTDSASEEKSEEDRPWLTWHNNYIVTTDDGVYAMHFFIK